MDSTVYRRLVRSSLDK